MPAASASTLVRSLAATALAVGLVITGATTGSAAPAPAVATSTGSAVPTTTVPASTAPAGAHVQHACATPRAGRMSCYAELVVPSRAAQAAAAAAPDASAAAIPGLRPADIASAYGLSGGTRGTIGIVDAYDNPDLESDLAVYRARWGLPACTTANGCFSKVNQQGSRVGLPEQDAGWGLEEALDVDAASAACPSCRILVVEATAPSTPSLGTAVDTAVRLGADAVSNSYGGEETTGVRSVGTRFYTHPGVAILASTGDDGFEAPSTPADFSSVVAVGGTTLTKNSSARGWGETAWFGGGSGCSAYIARPAWQPASHCPMRANGDLSAVADPDTGLAVYDTFGTASDTQNGWLQVGGTSLSSPLVTAMLVRSGRAASYDTAQRAYQRIALFNDVTKGSNGACGGDTLCTAKPGWDAPTGVGTPASLASF